MRAKIILIFSALILMSSQGRGQDDQFIILYTNSSSGIMYTAPQVKPQRVIAGIKLANKGQMRLEQGKWVNLLYNGKKKRLDGPGIFDMAKLASSIQSEKKSTFMNRFWGFLGNSVSKTEKASDLEKYHKEYLTNVRAGINGFGDAKFAIQAPIYLSELIGDPHVNFHWDSIPTLNGYTFEITSRETEQVVFQALTRGHSITVNLDELNLKHGEVYKWIVKAVNPDNTLAVSPSSFFAYAPQEVADLIQDIQSDDDYIDLEPSEQPLFLLQQLEEEGAYQAAFLKYQEMIKQESENLLYQKLFAAFLARMNALEEAKLQLSE